MRSKLVLLCAVLATTSAACKKKGTGGGSGGWFVGEGGTMKNVDDDGAVGEGYDLGASETLHAIACRYLDEAWVVGDHGTLLYTVQTSVAPCSGSTRSAKDTTRSRAAA